MSDPFANLPRHHFGAIYADPPWHFKVYSLKDTGRGRHPSSIYSTMTAEGLLNLPVAELALPDSILLMWFSWPQLEDAMTLIKAWGFTYKTCGFSWIKASATQIEFFHEETKADMTLGYWTRANSEACLLATRGSPKRLDAGVRQAIIEPRREHSRKPDCVYGRIERLVAGPYLELFARNTRPGWTSWGNETGKHPEVAADLEPLSKRIEQLGLYEP